jgi:hypothetical protein
MIKILKALSILVILISLSQKTYSQVYLGGAGVISQFSPSALEEYRGFGAIIQRQINLKDRFSLTPTFQGNLLTDKQYLEFSPEFYTTVSLATHINYDIISTKKIKISPFVGPSFVWATGIRSGRVFLDQESINFYRLGLETGLSLAYVHSEKFSLKFIPLTYTWGTKDFVQGNLFSLLLQIM